jgi:chromosomal replication initiator protein
MATGDLAVALNDQPVATQSGSPSLLWARASQSLKREMGEDAFGSWLGRAALKTGPEGDLVLVTPTGLARDWVLRNAWRRIEEVWAGLDPQRRPLSLRSRLEFDGLAGQPGQAATALPVPVPASPAHREAAADAARAVRDGFCFDSFVTGPANEFAYAVGRRVASWAEGMFSPVVIHGPFGCGKTHLMRALAREAQAAEPRRKVVFLTAEQFLTGFIQGVIDKKMGPFKELVRGADLLLLDDVHTLGPKLGTQEELLFTLMALMEDGRRVVISADKPPAALAGFSAHLRSHLSAGLVCGIAPADRGLRLAILRRRVEVLRAQFGFAGDLRPEVLEFLADRFTDTVRELVGALNTLVVRGGTGVAALSLEETHVLLAPHLRCGERRVTVDDIQKAAAEHFGLRQADLLSERRTRAVARPRQAAMWLAKQLTTRSLPDIGRRFGGRDHTTVLHAVRRIDALRAGDPQLARDLETLTRKLRG